MTYDSKGCIIHRGEICRGRWFLQENNFARGSTFRRRKFNWNFKIIREKLLSAARKFSIKFTFIHAVPAALVFLPFSIKNITVKIWKLHQESRKKRVEWNWKKKAVDVLSCNGILYTWHVRMNFQVFNISFPFSLDEKHSAFHFHIQIVPFHLYACQKRAYRKEHVAAGQFLVKARLLHAPSTDRRLSFHRVWK